jgi:hypothetical protein
MIPVWLHRNSCIDHSYELPFLVWAKKAVINHPIFMFNKFKYAGSSAIVIRRSAAARFFESGQRRRRLRRRPVFQSLFLPQSGT